MNQEPIKLRFPLWQFLNQPLFCSKNQFVLNPTRFAYLYRIQLLERCWDKECSSKGRHCN
ncbi:MAG TPA: hypothetical protein DCE56_19190 [Cyanobacteria bacterium UBA8553]|nr:hypothetical protein [Cyanobacteria bacterium UBA8553]HAJ63819.1 hypothetical protein [Cyanobacteria bacterium UBA8543]